MMRFYDDVSDSVEDHLCGLIEEPWSVFTVDLLYFFACEYETGWIPYVVERKLGEILIPGPRNYTPHPLSPFTNNMRRSIKCGFLPSDEAFEDTYNHIVPPDAEDKLARFLDHVVHAFDDFFSEDRTMKDMYFILLYVGKLATIFHLNGTPDAPQCSLALISKAVLKLVTRIPMGQAFEAMDCCAKVIYKVFDEKRRA